MPAPDRTVPDLTPPGVEPLPKCPSCQGGYAKTERGLKVCEKCSGTGFARRKRAQEA